MFLEVGDVGYRNVESDDVDLYAKKGHGADPEPNKLVFLFVCRWGV